MWVPVRRRESPGGEVAGKALAKASQAAGLDLRSLNKAVVCLVTG